MPQTTRRPRVRAHPARGGQYGFFPGPGTDYSRGQEPEIARRLAKLGRALRLHLIGISGYRSPAHSVEVGGFADDPHTRGQASDTPGVESVSEATLRRFGLTRPFPGSAEADHIQLLGGARGTTKPARSGPRYTLADYWTQGGGSRGLAPIMAAIGMAESGGRVDAVGGPNNDGTYDYGWLQINSSHGYDPARLISDPVYTARAGVAIERSQGLGAWTTYKSGAYRSFLGSGTNAVPKQGRIRPGGAEDDGSNDANTVFASYLGETDANQNVGFIPTPFGPINIPGFNPLDVFKNTAGAVKDVGSFLKFVAWIFHPRNVLRVVEFLTGLTLLVIGIQTAIQVHKDAPETTLGKVGGGAKKGAKEAMAATPVGRGARVAKGVRAGKKATRAASRRKEFEGGYKRGKRGETKRGNERAMNRKYGGVPF